MGHSWVQLALKIYTPELILCFTVLRFCLLGPMSLSFSCHCIRCTNHRREHSQENESHTLIGLFPRKECMSVWSSRVGMGSVTWLRPEWLRRRLTNNRLTQRFLWVRPSEVKLGVQLVIFTLDINALSVETQGILEFFFGKLRTKTQIDQQLVELLKYC